VRASLRKQRDARPARTSGDHSAVAPPVPIPNTEVKRCSPDGSTATGRARVGRRQSKMPGGLFHRAFYFRRCHSSTAAGQRHEIAVAKIPGTLSGLGEVTKSSAIPRSVRAHRPMQLPLLPKSPLIRYRINCLPFARIELNFPSRHILLQVCER
jgi:hypothetical protein